MYDSRILEVLIKPMHSLHEGLFLRKLGGFLAQVRTNREAVLDAREQVDLVRGAHLLEDVLRLVAFLGGEDVVGFCYRSVRVATNRK